MTKALIYICIPFIISFSGDSGITSKDNLLDIPKQCEAPEKLKAVEITSTSALLDWKGPLRDYYEVEWGNNGFKQGTGTKSNSNTRSLPINGLSPDKPYDYYVRANCGGTEFTEWVGPYTFVTDKALKTQ